MSAEHEQDLEFMRWVRVAPMAELMAQFRFACGWQRIAIERELARRRTR